MTSKILYAGLWLVFFATGLIVAIWLAWMAMAQVDFGFAAGYRVLDVGAHIAEFGPQNRYRHGFAQTDQAQHLQLFGEIVTAIHQGGQGLADIHYQLPDGKRIPLMREPEVIHLQDVANLIDAFYGLAAISLLLWIAVTAWFYRVRKTLPDWRATTLGILGFSAACLGMVFAVGPKMLFYWLHIQLFPPEHEWFFFYQDSLMTTLMKAPDIFGFISALIAVLALLIYGFMLWATQRTLRKQAAARAD